MESIKQKEQRLIGERDARMVGYIKDRLTVADIAHREGLEHRFTISQRLRVARENGLTIEDGVAEKRRFGIDDESNLFRNNMAHLLNQLMTTRGKGLRPMEVSHAIGLNLREQKRASNMKHDWTLSQMQRMAVAWGKTFPWLLEYCSKPLVHGGPIE